MQISQEDQKRLQEDGFILSINENGENQLVLASVPFTVVSPCTEVCEDDLKWASYSLSGSLSEHTILRITLGNRPVGPGMTYETKWWKIRTEGLKFNGCKLVIMGQAGSYSAIDDSYTKDFIIKKNGPNVELISDQDKMKFSVQRS
jgi:hypothetical protein